MDKKDWLLDSGLLRAWKQGTIGYIQLHRPEKANAYNESLLDNFSSTLPLIESDDSIRVIVICGAGNRSFCAGADLEEMQTKDYRSALNLKSAKLFHAISSSSKITLACINGAAVGGGLELALACDLRISSNQARFFFPETKLGLIPAAGGTQRLAQLLGMAKAKELILGGRIWSAEEAFRIGLVTEIVPFMELMSKAQKWGEEIAQRDPVALEFAKKAIEASSNFNAGFNYERIAEALLYQLKMNKK